MGVLYVLEDIRNPVLDFLFSLFTFLGSEAAVLVLAMVLLWCGDKKFGRLVLYTVFFSLGSNILLKNIFRVPRPWVRDPSFTAVESALPGATGYSFPSGHTANAVTSYGCVAVFGRGRAVRIICGSAVFLIALSRLYLGVHTFWDVLVSLVLGVVILFAVEYVYRRSLESRKFRNLLDGACVVFAVVMLAYVLLTQGNGDSELDAEGVKNAYSAFGAVLAFVFAMRFDDAYIKYPTEAALWAQALKLVLGAVLVFGVKEILKEPLNMVFAYHPFAHAVRYFFMVAVGGVIWPMSFGVWSRLGRARKKNQ